MRFCRRRSKTNPPTTPALVIRKQFLIHFSTPINAHLIITVPEVSYCRVVRKCGRVCLQRHRLALLCETACVCRHGRTNSSCQNYHKCGCEKAAHVDLHLEQGKTKRPSFLMELFSNHHSRKSAACFAQENEKIVQRRIDRVQIARADCLGRRSGQFLEFLKGELNFRRSGQWAGSSSVSGAE